MSVMGDAMLWVQGDLAVLGCVCAYRTRPAARQAVRSLKRRFRRVEVPTVLRIEMMALLLSEGFHLVRRGPKHPFFVWEAKT